MTAGSTQDPTNDPTVDDGVTAASTSPAAVRPAEGPGISDTDSAAERADAGAAGREHFERAGETDHNRF